MHNANDPNEQPVSFVTFEHPQLLQTMLDRAIPAALRSRISRPRGSGIDYFRAQAQTAGLTLEVRVVPGRELVASPMAAPGSEDSVFADLTDAANMETLVGRMREFRRRVKMPIEKIAEIWATSEASVRVAESGSQKKPISVNMLQKYCEAHGFLVQVRLIPVKSRAVASISDDQLWMPADQPGQGSRRKAVREQQGVGLKPEESKTSEQEPGQRMLQKDQLMERIRQRNDARGGEQLPKSGPVKEEKGSRKSRTSPSSRADHGGAYAPPIWREPPRPARTPIAQPPATTLPDQTHLEFNTETQVFTCGNKQLAREEVTQLVAGVPEELHSRFVAGGLGGYRVTYAILKLVLDQTRKLAAKQAETEAASTDQPEATAATDKKEASKVVQFPFLLARDRRKGIFPDEDLDDSRYDGAYLNSGIGGCSRCGCRGGCICSKG